MGIGPMKIDRRRERYGCEMGIANMMDDGHHWNEGRYEYKVWRGHGESRSNGNGSVLDD